LPNWLTTTNKIERTHRINFPDRFNLGLNWAEFVFAMKNRISPLFSGWLFALLLANYSAFSQEIAVGAWRTHLTYHNAQALADAGDRVFVASTNGLFSVDKITRETRKFSKVDGLSDIAFSALAWDAPRQTLIIAYANGNLDLLSEAEIVNLRAIVDARLEPFGENRRINHIQLAGNTAYLSTAFGVAVLDLARREIRDTYTRLGPGGSPVTVWASAAVRDSLFLATSQGLLVASLAPTVNRQDFRNWRIVAQPAPGALRTVAALGTSLLVGIDGQDIFSYVDGQFRPLNIGRRTFRDLRASGQTVIACSGNLVHVIGPDGTRTLSDPRLVAPAQALADGATFWVADQSLGLVSNVTGSWQNSYPSGTYNPAVFKLAFFQDRLVALAGGYDLTTFRPSNLVWGFYVFKEGTWQNFNSVDNLLGSVRTPAARDLVSAAFNPADGRAYLASFQDGLFEWNLADNSFRSVNAQNLALGTSISAVQADLRGNLNVATISGRFGGPSVFRRSPEGAWRSFALPGSNGGNPVELLTDEANNLWVRLSPATGGGLVVLDEAGRSKSLGTAPGQGNLPSANINALALDQEGSVWVGTDNGLGVFFGAAGILGRTLDAARVVFQNRELLRGEPINCIAVDGGNRKWIGTNSGVWLFSGDGSEQISRFTAANSPLLSDQVLSIAIQAQTGEVFFATDRGIVSYRGTATEGGETHGNVQVFPNPVPPGFAGVVTVTGLVANANVKITDVAGRLVYETTANGGTATWSGTDYRGSRARTGVYLVYATSQDGSARFVTKFVWVD